MEETIIKLKEQISALNNNEKSLNSKLKLINDEIDNLSVESQLPDNLNYSFDAIIKTYSNRDIKQNLSININSLNEQIETIQLQVNDIQEEIEDLESSNGIRERKDKFKKYLKYFYEKLNVDTEIWPSQVHFKPNLTGSSSSRSILAAHLAYITLSYELTDFPLFPIIIDTIQQNGQDIPNIDKMVSTIAKFKQHQIILGMETLPNNHEKFLFKILGLRNKKNSVLSSNTYLEHLAEIDVFNSLNY